MLSLRPQNLQCNHSFLSKFMRMLGATRLCDTPLRRPTAVVPGNIVHDPIIFLPLEPSSWPPSGTWRGQSVESVETLPGRVRGTDVAGHDRSRRQRRFSRRQSDGSRRPWCGGPAAHGRQPVLLVLLLHLAVDAVVGGLGSAPPSGREKHLLPDLNGETNVERRRARGTGIRQSTHATMRTHTPTNARGGGSGGLRERPPSLTLSEPNTRFGGKQYPTH